MIFGTCFDMMSGPAEAVERRQPTTSQLPWVRGTAMPPKHTTAPVPGQFREFFSRLEGRQLGAFKRAAKLALLTFDEYVGRLDCGDKRCTRCRRWLPMEDFGVDHSRWDGLDAHCLECKRGVGRERYIPVPFDRLKPLGPPRQEPRDGDKLQARHLINLDVERGRRPSPNDLHCAACGHKGCDRRHEYHHHMGYEARHHYDVIPLCSTCHHQEHD